ncbi:MAG: hypothetical protein NVSMB3_00910 [Acidobacteriaceae bacterium]
MFEDSLMESGGKIKTKSKYWMIGTFIFNGSILAILILIPLLYPEALPKTAMTAMLTGPPPPPPPTPPPPPPPGHAPGCRPPSRWAARR